MRVVIPPTEPEIAERFPLTLKWRRTWGDDSHFTARDPDRSREVEVAMFSANLDSSRMNISSWSWRCSMHNVFHVSVIDQLGKSCSGQAGHPRIAAWQAEQAYMRYLAVISPELHALELSEREWREEGLQRIYAGKGMA